LGAFCGLCLEAVTLVYSSYELVGIKNPNKKPITSVIIKQATISNNFLARERREGEE
jgi:hypothetical protein